MIANRNTVLGVVVGVLGGVLLWHWISGWGTVTLNATNVPLAKVIKSIERQGRVKIITNADPATPVTLHARRAPVFDTIDTLAVRLDGNAQLAFVAAPDKAQITAVIDAFRSGANPGGWVVFSSGFGGRGIASDGPVPDPREVPWKVTAVADNAFHSLLEQGTQKTGALFAIPQEWNPSLPKIPDNGKIGEVASALAKSAQGQIREMFLITVRPPRAEGESERSRRPQTVFSTPRGERNRNPEWMAERAQAQIATLPPEKQEAARKQYDEMRALWKAIRELPREDRRAKIEELMQDPEIQARMEEYRAARDAKRTPEQREQRMKRYLDRKERMKNAPAQS